MTNMKTLQKINLLIITIVMMVAATISSSENLLAKTTQSQKTTLSSSSSNSCKVKQDEFRRLYLELQAKYLNYEGKDTTFDSKGNIVLVPHKEGAPYEGKEFEEAIFKEYLNSVSKVAKLFQDEKFRPEVSKTNEKLVDFLKAIDGNPEAFIENKNNDIHNIVEMLYQESNKRYKSGQDAKYALTERDKYLLKKLVTHAQDRICSVDHYKKTGTKTMYFTTTQLHQQMNGPINRIIYAIREANITNKQRIVLYEPDQLMVNGKEAVHSAIKAHINDIAKFVKENNACIARIKNLSFIQKNIQPCNYQRFMDSLKKGPGEFSELESILHFINANDHFFGYVKKTAETDLDPEILEMRTKLRLQTEDGEDVLSGLGCSKGQNEKGQEAIFLRNMPSKPGTKDEPDTSIIECFDAKSNEPLNAQTCQGLIKVEADYIGRGLVVKTVKEKDSGKYKFSIKGKPECSQVINNNLTGPNTDLLTDNGPGDETKCPIGQTFDKKQNKCVPLTGELCTEQGLILSPDKTECIEDPNAEKCPAGQVLNAENKCVPIDANYCKEQGMIFDPKEQKCIPDPNTQTTQQCLVTEYLNDDKKCVPIDADYCKKQNLEFDAEKKQCVDPKKDPQANQCKDNEELIEGKCAPKKDANKPADKKAECEKNNEDWLAKLKADGEPPKNRYVWEDDKCIDKMDKVKPKKDAAAAPIERLNLVDGPAPARFTPIQIPQRRFYVLPGMP